MGGSPLFKEHSAESHRPESPTMNALKLPSSVLDQDGDEQRHFSSSESEWSPKYAEQINDEARRPVSARVMGSGLLSPEAASFQPGSSSNSFVGVFGADVGVWNPDVEPQQDWSASLARSVSRSAPNTPRVSEWGSTMAYATAPVSPGVYEQRSPPPQASYAFPEAPDLLYSAPGAFGPIEEEEEDNDDDMTNMPKQAEHPSRTLFVRNLANDTDPLALQDEFEQFGPVRSIYANCKYRGFVMISFFDIRHSKAAMLVLNGKKVFGKKMDVHYALPKDNPGDKESNQGTLVVFNLDTTMSDEDIRDVFSDHGEVKDIRSTPNKNTHKFIEFFDVRDAERALVALNRTKVRSKIIKIEVSRPSNRGRRKGPELGGQMMPPPGGMMANAGAAPFYYGNNNNTNPLPQHQYRGGPAGGGGGQYGYPPTYPYQNVYGGGGQQHPPPHQAYQTPVYWPPGHNPNTYSQEKYGGSGPGQ